MHDDTFDFSNTYSRAIDPLSSPALSFVAGGGEMGERIRSFDWGATALGALAGWPQSLPVPTAEGFGRPSQWCFISVITGANVARSSQLKLALTI
jgi:hypothetical protein